MTFLRVVYNITSNKPPGYREYHDDTDSEQSRSTTPDIRASSRAPLLGTGDELEDDTSTSIKQERPSTSIGRAGAVAADWVKGPKPPRPWKITPILPSIQEAPIRLLDKYAPFKWQRLFLLGALYFFYILAFVLVLRKSAFSSDVPGYGSPARISCGASFWSAKNSCGLDGLNCRPFSNDTLAFRCPANCIKTKALNPHAVGDQEVIYNPVVIGGPINSSDPLGSAIYRADSFICASAIHAGFINNRDGGCGVVSLIGEAQNYPSSSAHGIISTAFPSSFPRSFSFLPGTQARCKDLRWPLLGVSVTFTALLALFTTSAPIFFFTTYTSLFFHVALASDPPNRADYHDLLSLALGKFLPSTFVMYVLYRYCARRTLTNLTAQVEKTVLWLGACWVGALNNYTFDRIPIQRLTPHDLHQPGAIPALIIIVLAIFFIALGQAWAIRVEGKMPQYLALYGMMVFTLLMLVAVPGMNVRIHHYILALLLVPGTAMQNRPSLLYQGLLIGLFINGIARWGYDSILQTPGELLGDGQLGSLLPTILSPIITSSNITFSWLPIPRDRYDGISVLVNDVERFRGYVGEFEGEVVDGVRDGGVVSHAVDGGVERWTWERRKSDEGRSEFFRFGYMSGSSVGDYTKAGVWRGDGGWVHMRDGASK